MIKKIDSRDKDALKRIAKAIIKHREKKKLRYVKIQY